jgi:hypothetical protein
VGLADAADYDDRFWTSRRKELPQKMAAGLLKKGRTSVKGLWPESAAILPVLLKC